MDSRTIKVLGKNKHDKIKNSTIAILGLGGVGGYVVEMFARLGVQNLVLVDFDKIEKSNINRQIIALNSTIGKLKTEEFKNRIFDINQNCKTIVFSEKIDKNNISKILTNKIDYVVDAIDDVDAKIEVVKFCKLNNIKLISSMGTGNRYKQVDYQVCDISKTSYDGLARIMRKKLKDNEIYSLDVCFTKQQPESCDGIGSVVYHPLMCAAKIVNFIVETIVN